MPDTAPIFSQPERRSFLVPILLALAAIAAAVALAIHFFPSTTVDLEHLHTDAVPTDTLFKGSTIVGVADKQHILFVASRIKVDNRLRVPIYLDDFSIDFLNADSSELTVTAPQKNELPDLETNYPALKPLLTAPLLRNTEIDPGKSAEGTVVFPLKIPDDMWNQRKSATIKVELYHQPSVYVTIPK